MALTEAQKQRRYRARKAARDRAFRSRLEAMARVAVDPLAAGRIEDLTLYGRAMHRRGRRDAARELLAVMAGRPATPAEARALRRLVLELRGEGLAPAEVAAILAEDGEPTPDGGRWDAAMVRRIEGAPGPGG